MRRSEHAPETMTGDPLEIEQLRVSYGTAVVLDGLSLQVREGEMVGLAGRNGAGKTTTLRAISGLVATGGGSIRSAGAPLPTDPELVLRAGVAHVPEGRRVFASLTVEENLRAAALGAKHPFDAAQREHVLELFPPLQRLMDRKAGYLSGGEQQMLAISRGLVARPRLLMIDEVSLGLAPRLVGDMWKALSSLRGHELALLVVDQNVRILSVHCDRIYLLDHGRVTEASTGDARDEELRALYFD
jgi:branched-chain amino acid transport system ATP-binding protein